MFTTNHRHIFRTGCEDKRRGVFFGVRDGGGGGGGGVRDGGGGGGVSDGGGGGGGVRDGEGEEEEEEEEEGGANKHERKWGRVHKSVSNFFLCFWLNCEYWVQILTHEKRTNINQCCVCNQCKATLTHCD